MKCDKKDLFNEFKKVKMVYILRQGVYGMDDYINAVVVP